jgi:glycosyltransferase involved in cell wall biosynthesis
VSVVLPVHNAGEHLTQCLDSVMAQVLTPEEFELIAIDDGSNDGSGEFLDAYAAARPNVRVIHEAPSGGPGRPRNVGTAVAGGEFVFYLDADDSLAAEALDRMLAFAGKHESDLVVVGEVVVEDGKTVMPLGEPRVIVDAPLHEVFTAITPHKLIRRTLLMEHRIRFPEGAVTFEDGIFLAQVAPRARRISVLQDRAYYVKRRHPGGLSHRSRALGRARSVMRIVEILRELDADANEIDLVAFRRYQRLLRGWNLRHFLRLPSDKQARLVATMHELATTLVPTARDSDLSYPLRLRSLAFRTGRTAVVAALAEAEQDERPIATVRRRLLLPLVARAALATARRKALQSTHGDRIRAPRALRRLLRDANAGNRP